MVGLLLLSHSNVQAVKGALAVCMALEKQLYMKQKGDMALRTARVPYFFDQTLQPVLCAMFALVQLLLQVDVCSFVDMAG